MLSMSEKMFPCLVVVLCVSATTFAAVGAVDYSATIEPDIANKSIKGSVSIRVLTSSDVVVFDCGDLTIDSVTESGKPLQFSVNDHKLRISLAVDKKKRG